MEKHTLKAEKRKVLGRKVKTLRQQDLLPANIYGKQVKSEAVQVVKKEFTEVYAKAGETGIVELLVGKEKRPVLVHEVQVSPVSDEPIHVDFLQVDLKQKVLATVPVDITGESPAEKAGIGTMVQQLNEIEVEALPGDLPERFVVDAAKLTEVDQAVKVMDLDYDKSKVEVKVDSEQIVVKVEPPQKEEAVVPPAPAEGEEAPAEVKEGEVAAKPEGEEAKEEEKTEQPEASKA